MEWDEESAHVSLSRLQMLRMKNLRVIVGDPCSNVTLSSILIQETYTHVVFFGEPGGRRKARKCVLSLTFYINVRVSRRESAKERAKER